MALNFREIDLHGMTVDEAIFTLEQEIPALQARGVDDLLIIHGKGEGILRSEVLRYLKSGACSRYLSGVYPGDKHKLDGGNGVVKVTFKVTRVQLGGVKVKPLKKLPPEQKVVMDELSRAKVQDKKAKGKDRYLKMLSRSQTK